MAALRRGQALLHKIVRRLSSGPSAHFWRRGDHPAATPGTRVRRLPPRAHAPHLEDRDHPAARHQQPAATGPLRRLRPRVQSRQAPPGPRHEAARRPLPTRHRSYTGLPEIEYPLHDRDVLVTACGRICMHRKKINISTVMAGQTTGTEGGRRRHLGRNLHGLRPRIYRLGTENPATYRQPVRHPGVTHVLGTLCHPCVRVGQTLGGCGGPQQLWQYWPLVRFPA